MSNTALPHELLDQVRLSLVEGVGPRLREQLLARFDTIGDVLAAPLDELQAVDGIGPKLAKRIAASCTVDAEAEIELARHHHVDILCRQDSGYPPLLREIHDPPGVLYRRGAAVAEDQLAVAIVGTRHATQYGLRQAQRLASGLARVGFTIVSGLARGIDAAAHQSALAAGGRTVAVLAGGLLKIYPPEHTRLADQIAERGFLLSEAPLRMVPIAGAFPQRNRIVSGLTLGTIVVEAPRRSGALITARHAYEQGREVFAVPGPVDSRMSQGTHALIKDGATLVESVDDVLDQLGPLAKPIDRPDGTSVRQPQELTLNEVEQQVLQAVEACPTSIDLITQATGLPIQRVLSTISVLEMRRLVRRVSGNQVVRV